MKGLKGKVAVITGCGGGLGRAVAQRLAEEGAKLVLVDYKEDIGQETLRQAKEKGAEAIFVRADVSKVEDIQNYVREAVNKFGRIDAFYNNAGIEGSVAPTADYSVESFDQVIAVNLRGVFLGLKYVIPVMAGQKSGTIVNTSSIGGLVAHANFSGYVASKHAVTGMTKVAGVEYGGQGIRVNAICPGPINTDMVKNAAIKYNPDNPQEYYGVLNSLIPVQRVGEPEEVAGLVAFLLSDEAPYINGATVAIDGGMTSI